MQRMHPSLASSHRLAAAAAALSKFPRCSLSSAASSCVSPSPLFSPSLSPSVISSLDSLSSSLIAGDRRSLSKCITLIESSLPSHKHQASYLLQRLRTLRSTAAAASSSSPSSSFPSSSSPSSNGLQIRIGISGSPGVGKSTFIDHFFHWVLSSRLPASSSPSSSLSILSIDPSSIVTGGSILGDKTRMSLLSSLPSRVYIRPSPNRCLLGGVNRGTFDSIELLEAAGFPLIVVETVGVGQSEINVRQCCDLLILLVSPGGGDDLQGMKKGIVECADMVVVNKADLNPAQANYTKSDYQQSIDLLHAVREKGKEKAWKPTVFLSSNFPGGVGRGGGGGEGGRKDEEGEKGRNAYFEKIWENIVAFDAHHRSNGLKEQRRRDQLIDNFWLSLNEEILSELRQNERYTHIVEEMKEKIMKREITPRAAAQQVLHGSLGLYK